MTIDLTGKHALVTGGSRGIGSRLARALHDAGAQVVIFYNHTDAGALARRCRARARRYTRCGATWKTGRISAGRWRRRWPCWMAASTF